MHQYTTTQMTDMVLAYRKTDYNGGVAQCTLREMCGTTWMPHIQTDGLAEGVLFHGLHDHQILHLSTFSLG